MKTVKTLKALWKRALCLLLALELFGAPVAMARAQGNLLDERPVDRLEERDTPAETAPVAETAAEAPVSTPTGEESGDRAEPMDYLPYFSHVILGGGVDTAAKYHSYFAAESTGTWGSWDDASYGDEEIYYVRRDMGRLPDMELMGYYVYEHEDVLGLLEVSREYDLLDVAPGWSYDQIQAQDAPIALEFLSYNQLPADIQRLLRDEARGIDKDAPFAAHLAGAYGKIVADDALSGNNLPLVARWVPSSRAQAMDLAVTTGNARGDKTQIETLYTADIAGKSLEDMADDTLALADFDGSADREFWLRVPHDQESLSLSFTAFEPYFDYLKQNQAGDPLLKELTASEAVADCPVTVRATYGADGREVPLPANAIAGEMVNGGSREYNGVEYSFYFSQNTKDKPARSHWTVEEIPLTVADGDAQPVTTVTVTLTAPDGVSRVTYTFHISRLAEQTVTLAAGNSPVGTILRDNSAIWREQKTYTDSDSGETRYFVDYSGIDTNSVDAVTEANKDFAIREFARRFSYHGVYYPQESANLQHGAVYRGTYFDQWTGENLDLSESAVFVYPDSAFRDPGISFTDSEGKAVRFGEAAEDPRYENCVARLIKLRTADSLTVDLYTNVAGGSDEVWYDGTQAGEGRLQTTATANWLRKGDGSDQVDLRGLRVVPGIYEILYIFTDPLTREETRATRPLVVLPLPGDVDMDGAVTPADGVALEKNMTLWNEGAGATVSLVRSRVMDVTGTGTLTAGDVSKLMGGFQPVLARAGGGDYRYIPLPQGDSAVGYTRKTWDEVNAMLPDGAAGKLVLEYLGVETGTYNSATGTTYLPTGPWAAQENLGVSLPGKDEDHSTFWMGVRLELEDESALRGRRVEDLTVSLIYDSRYIRPATVLTTGLLEQLEGSGASTPETRWRFMLRYYNLLAGSYVEGGVEPHTLWGNRGTLRYDLSEATVQTRNYDTTHYSKVISKLEEDIDTQYLREMVFSVKDLGLGGTELRSGYVMAVPFTLYRQPTGAQEHSRTRLVELSGGMRDLNMVTAPGTGKGLMGEVRAALLANVPATTSAFSAQESIFGNATENLREDLTCESDGVGLVLLGKDNSTRTVLLNELTSPASPAKYATDFSVATRRLAADFSGQLPQGLSYNPSTGIISGSPEEIGTFSFELDGLPYSLTVEPRTIRFYADGYNTYYGEVEFRGQSPVTGENPNAVLPSPDNQQYRTFTYRYFSEDIAQIDRDRAAAAGIEWSDAASRSGTELGRYIEGYGEPAFAASTQTRQQVGDGLPTGDWVDEHTDVGSYTIYAMALPRAKNYVFEYVSRAPVGERQGVNTLTVLQRPVRIDYLVIPSSSNPTKTLYHDEGEGVRENMTAFMGDEDVTIALTHLTYSELPLSGDALVPGDRLGITFNGKFLRTEADKLGGGKGFILQAKQEDRQLEVSAVRLVDMPGTAYGCVKNYALNTVTYGHPEQFDVRGIVVRRGVTAIEITQLPPELDSKRQGGQTVIYTGGGVNDPGQLGMILHKGSGAGAEDVALYRYDNLESLSLGIHYNWVTPEEYELYRDTDTLEGTGRDLATGKDLRPYGRVRDGVVVEGMEEQRFTPAENGWRVCISVNIFSEGDDQGYMKYYTDPIIVRPRQITLAPQSAQRYYGDDNGTLVYTYSTNTLSNADLSKINEHFGHRATGAMEELEWLLNEEKAYYDETYPGKYTVTPPTMTAQVSVTDETPVTAATNAQGTPYTLVLSGARSVNYNFVYRSADGTTSEERGLSNLTVHPRPIVVDTVARYGAGGQEEPFAILYADTKKLTQAGDRALRVGGALPEVTFRLPAQNAEGKPTYYVHRPAVGNQPAGATVVNSQVVLRSAGTSAVVNGDADKLTVRYSTTFVPDKISHNSFTDSYYPVHNFDKTDGDNAHRDEVQTDGSRHVSVQVDTLELEGPAARNYLLVYATPVGAMQRVPNIARQVLAPNPTAPAGQQASYSYQTSGYGTVWLRPIKSMTLTTLGQMEYTYGERFSPDLSGPTGGVMTLEVEYETEYDNDPEHNTQSDRVAFAVTGSGNSFTDLGFTMGYAKAGQTVADAFGKGQTLDYLEYLTPGTHDGAYLWVVGRRSPQDPLIYSRLSSIPLTVRKRTLTLKASNVHRFYGEVDTVKGGYTFTALARELAEPDWRALGYESEPGQAVRVDAAALQTLAGYRAPTFRSEAQPGSPVGEQGYGVYDLHMSSGGNWDNYIIQTEGASVYVYPRPIHTTGIASDEKNPVYVIFHNAQDVVFESQLGTKRDESFGAATATVQVGLLITGLEYVELADGGTDYLPVTGSALYGTDQLTFNIRVDYGKFDATGDFADKNDIETRTSVLSLAGGNRNYRLADTSVMEYDTIGAARLRTIHQIHIVNPPKLEYTYGEELNLSGLQVRIEYARLNQTEESEFITVSYQGQDQFKSYGLYVNYYGSGSIPADTSENKATWKAVPATYRVADSGDHVTIAPTHDTQGYAVTHSSPLYQQFKANGMNLIISAFQEGEKQVAARPVIVGERNNMDYYEGSPTPIVVHPRQLTYTLSATDKTYDGTSATAGTLTLTNVFQQAGRVDAYNLSGVTDVVYIPLGASYESGSLDHNSPVYQDFKDRVAAGQVAFNTGSYTENGAAPLLENGRLTWSANGTAGTYRYGTGLTFAFTNPNVHYEDDSYTAGRPGLGTADLARYWAATQEENQVTTRWDSFRAVSALPVEVTGMVLAGPDAANYTWGPSTSPRVSETSVTVATRAQSERGQAAAPFATIHKANRDTIQDLLSGNVLFYPKLEIDRHTNVVRMTYGQDLGALGDNNNRDQTTSQAAATTDVFRDELHFEYALYYQDKETGLYTQWAGPTGGKGYQDTLFFGGEAVRPAAPEGYLPNVDQLPRPDTANENTVYKGQLYRWAELDTGLSARGWREDGGFTEDPAAYPGGAGYRDNYWFYSLYTTDRAALPRDTVVYPLVRLAETHNYNASGDLSGRSEATAALLNEAQRAVAAYRADPEDEELLAQALAASEAVFGAPTAAMRQEALDTAQAQMDYDYALGANSQWPEVPVEGHTPAAAVKTFVQRVDLVSSSQERSDPKLGGGDQEYLVKLLEAVWFTDTLRYEEERYLDAVLYNHPTRYYGYYYDVDLSAEISFTEAPLFDLSDIIGPIPIRRQLENGQSVEETIVVNQDHTLTLYVQINMSDGRKVRYLELQPNVINAVLGDGPITLEVLTIPETPSNRRYRWTTSDPAVATVDENGVVTFRGLGTAVITIHTDNKRTASVTVYVRPQVTPLSTGTMFNTFYTGSFMELSEDGLFYPKNTIRRGDLVMVLDLFRTSTALEGKTRDMDYVDITQAERYADALARMTALGVVTGVPGNAFEGEREATRGEFAAMIARYIQLDVVDTRGRRHWFGDAGEEDTWAYSYIDALAQTGVMLGTGGGNFAPDRAITREEVAAVLARLLTVPLNTLGVEPKKPADVVPENWAYEAILRAVNTIEFPQPYPGEVQQKLAQDALEREKSIIPGNKVGGQG